MTYYLQLDKCQLTLVINVLFMPFCLCNKRVYVNREIPRQLHSMWLYLLSEDYQNNYKFYQKKYQKTHNLKNYVLYRYFHDIGISNNCFRSTDTSCSLQFFCLVIKNSLSQTQVEFHTITSRIRSVHCMVISILRNAFMN